MATIEEIREEYKKRYAYYLTIKDKAKVKCVSTGYAHKKYVVLENPEGLSRDDLALICDKGNLCFGYRNEGGLIVVHTD